MHADEAWAFEKFHFYKTEKIKTITSVNGQPLILERAYVLDKKISKLREIERIQIRDEQGNIVAYTPTRVTAIPVCFSTKYCWVFMWKTVYPFPAIFKFDFNQENWSSYVNFYMQYSRYGPYFEGFTEHYNLIFGAFGVLLLILKLFWYFCLCIIFSIIMCIQISSFRNLDKKYQRWITRLLLFMTLPLKMPYITLEPYTITAGLLFLWICFGIVWLGVPLVITAAVVMSSFFVCAYRIGKANYKKSN